MSTWRRSFKLISDDMSLLQTQSLTRAFMDAEYALGERMYAAGIDDGELVRQIAVLEEKDCQAEGAPGSARESDADRKKLVLRLSAAALREEAPLPGAEAEYQHARKAQAALRLHTEPKKIRGTSFRKMPVVNTVSNMAQCPAEGNLAVPVLLPDLGSRDEHVAILVDLRGFGTLRHWNNLLDEGVAAVFGLASGEAELLALSFHAGKFTPAGAATWLAERGFKPLFCVPNSGRLAATNFDAPLAEQFGRVVLNGTVDNTPVENGNAVA